MAMPLPRPLLRSVCNKHNAFAIPSRARVLHLRTAAPSLHFSTYTTPQSSSSSTTTNGRSSVDPQELQHFNTLASSWWDPHGPSRLLHLMNPLRITFIRSCLSSAPTAAPTDNLHYLDVGCGGGIFAESAARLPSTASVTALDPSSDVVAVAEAHKRRDPTLMQPGRLTYLCKGVEELEVSQGEGAGYDIVTLFEVLEHVTDPSAFLDSVTRHVRPGGWLVLSTIARTWTSWVTTKVVAEDLLRIVPRGTHDWGKYLNEHEVREWFAKRGGWDSARAMGVVYVPGVGWREVRGAEQWGNYFFAIRKSEDYK